MKRRLAYAAATAAGPVRPINEDSVLANGIILAGDDTAAVCGELLPDTVALFVVADGIGGHPCGEVASRLVVTSLGGRPPDPSEASCSAAVRCLNLELHSIMGQQPQTLGMGAVLAGVICHGSTLYWFNVGDCRVYKSLPDGRLLQLSIDDIALAVPGRAAMVSAALGGRRTIAPVDPHTGCTELSAGDRVMLCSDGVVACLDQAVIADGVHRAETPAAAVRDLMAACQAGRAQDNLSVVVLGIEAC